MSESTPYPKSQVTVKTVLTVCSTVVGVAACAYIVVHSKVALMLVLTSALIAVALEHAVEWLRRKGLGRGLAVSAVMLALLASMTGAAMALLPTAASQLRALVENAPALIERAKDTTLYARANERFDLDGKIEQLRRTLPEEVQLEEAVDPALRVVSAVVASVAAAVTVLFLVLFMLIFGGRVIGGLLREALPAHRERYERVIVKIYHSIGGYLAGLSFICLVNAAATTLFLAVMRVPFFLALGLVSGLSSLIPLAGNTLAGVGIALIALLARGVGPGIACAVWFIVYQQFENHVLGPMVYRKTVNMNPLVVIVGLLIFTDLAGILGAIVTVPIVASAQIVLREVLAMRRERSAELPSSPTPVLREKLENPG